jgi:uroporphyrin-III C-methyltransferase/precorrin-2 dehydrogenase/sirohydrochlorin ferrochelatase
MSSPYARDRAAGAGRVVLVGAGPGDPDLLTVKAVRALATADMVFYDGHVSAGVLALARSGAELVSVAKARGRHSRTQAEINALIVRHAREGRTVVRLKGGDPFVFGRGGEEVDVLRASGIAVEVIPGITAATAVAASLQVPLTHRDFGQSVTFLSGHSAGDGRPDFDHVDLAALARGRATLAVYMGIATAGVLADHLIAAGWALTTPVLAVERASCPDERRIATTIGEIAATRGLGLGGQALLVIGEVAGLPAAGVVERLAALQPAEETQDA